MRKIGILQIEEKKEDFSMTDMHKCAVVGCGFVGASCAFSLVESGLFSEMVLIDVNKSRTACADGCHNRRRSIRHLRDAVQRSRLRRAVQPLSGVHEESHAKKLMTNTPVYKLDVSSCFQYNGFILKEIATL